jgi:hypothetical protein
VGRSDTIRDRLRRHGRPSSGHNAASLAFLMARRAAQEQGIDCLGRERRDLEANPQFGALFDAAKQRIRRMAIRAVAIDDPVTQAIFEVYVHVKLGTGFSSFDNH